MNDLLGYLTENCCKGTHDPKRWDRTNSPNSRGTRLVVFSFELHIPPPAACRSSARGQLFQCGIDGGCTKRVARLASPSCQYDTKCSSIPRSEVSTTALAKTL